MQRALPPHYTFRPVVPDHHTAARAYFLCVLGLLLVEGAIRLPAWIRSLRKRNHPPPPQHYPPTILLHKLLTHPSPLPLLTSHSLSTLLRLLLFVSLNLLFAWTRLRFTTDYQRFGYLTISNAGLALLLPTRHSNLFSSLLQIPPPVLLAYHRWAGLASVVHATLHFGLTAERYIHSEQFDAVLTNARIRVGIMAWLALVLVSITALRVIRRKCFEVFFYTHFLFLVFIAGALYHASAGPEFLLPGVGLWVIDRVWRGWDNWGKKITVTETRFHSGGLTKIRFTGVRVMWPAQMVRVQIPGVSRWNWHAFTVASAPGEETGVIAIRALGGFTKRVQGVDGGEGGADMAGKNGKTGKMFKMRLDGPYGVGNPRWTQTPVVVLVAGGIGITPGISIASHIVNEAARRGSSGGQRHIYLLWAVSDISHACWFEGELKAIAEVASRDDVLVSLRISIHVTTRGKVGDGQEEKGVEGTERAYMGPSEIHVGRPNILRWFQGVQELIGGSDVAVNVCGPQSLKDDVRRAALRVSSRDGLFFVHEEVFEL